MIAYKVYVDFDNDGSFATAGDDITDYVTSLQASLGMEDEQAHVATVGFCQVALNNASKAFSPEYSAGTYYGKLLPRLPFKVDVVEDGNTWTLFRGVTARWYAQSGKFGPRTATLEAECLLSVPQNYDVSLPLQLNTVADDLLKLVGSAAFNTARATGHIAFAGNVSNNDTVTVGDVTYTFKTALTSPEEAGEVLIGADAESSAANLIAAINGEEGAGTTYSTGTERADVATASPDGEALSIPTAGVAQGFAVGRWPDNDNLYYEGQSFTLETGGLLSEFALWFGNRGGSPVGTMTWKIFVFDPDAGETVGAALETGTFTPTTPEPVWNTVAAAGTTYLEPGVYKLELETTVDQASGDYWNVLASDGAAGDVYEDGTFWQLQADPLDEWGEWVGQDLTMTLTCAFQRVYLTANARGAWGNAIALAASGANLSVSGAALSGGVDGPAGLFSYEAGLQTFLYAADNWQGENTNGLRAIEEAVTSEWGYLWSARDGTLTFKNRDWIFKRQLEAAAMAFDNEPNMIDGSVDTFDIVNNVSVSYAPRRVAATAVVARATDGIRVLGKRAIRRRNSSDPYIGDVITLPFVDPEGGRTVAAKDLIHPVPGTDYRVTRGGQGLTADLSSEGYVTCTLARNANDVEVTFQNTAKLTYWVWDFQIRGAAVLTYNRMQSVRDSEASVAAYGRRKMDVELPLYSTHALAESIADYLVLRYATPVYRVPQIALRGRTIFGGVNIYSVEIGDMIEVTDDQTGLDSARFVIIGYTALLERGGYHELNWTVRRLDDRNFFILDDPVYSKLDGTNYLTI